MKLRIHGNRRSARALPALVALLYVFLCTFSTLTHTHAWLEPEMGPEEAAVSAVTTAAAKGGIVTQHPVGAPHCAFCDWQANSVSTALPILHHNLSPVMVALAAPVQAVLPITIRTVHTATRAPPAA